MKRDRVLWPTTQDGWALELGRYIDADHFEPGKRPVLVVPGYGMNGFVLRFHPRGISLVSALAAAGHEVWCGELRGQGQSRRIRRGGARPSLTQWAIQDIPLMVQHALENTRTAHSQIDLVGVSLGGSLSLAYLATHADPRVASMVTMASPLKWVEKPLVLRAAFRSRRVAGSVRFIGSRAFARAAVPAVARTAPWILGLYANAANIDISRVGEMLETVENPHPRVNRAIAAWIRRGDLVINGVNVVDALRAQRGPLLVIAANKDGVVPEPTALSVREAWGGDDITTLRVGDTSTWYAHADLFVGQHAPEAVFAPLVEWLERRTPAC